MQDHDPAGVKTPVHGSRTVTNKELRDPERVPTCPHCESRVGAISARGPSDHRLSCGCRVSAFVLSRLLGGAHDSMTTDPTTTSDSTDSDHQHDLVTDGGLDFEGLAELSRCADAAERQADALEALVEETHYQNAVLLEVAHALHGIGVANSEIAHPEEKPETRPSLRGLQRNVEDQEFTRNEGSR